MLDLSISENGNEVFKKNDQEFIFVASSPDKDYFIRGTSSVENLLELASNTLLFLYNTIISNYFDDYSLPEFINDVLNNITFDNKSDQAILKCSNPMDIFKAADLLLNLNQTYTDKNCEIVGLDFDELKNQIGDDDNENI